MRDRSQVYDTACYRAHSISWCQYRIHSKEVCTGRGGGRCSNRTTSSYPILVDDDGSIALCVCVCVCVCVRARMYILYIMNLSVLERRAAAEFGYEVGGSAPATGSLPGYGRYHVVLRSGFSHCRIVCSLESAGQHHYQYLSLTRHNHTDQQQSYQHR